MNFSLNAKQLLPITCLALAACAQTPDNVISTGDRFTFTSNNTPYNVAGCIARNADNLDSGLDGKIRPGTTEGSFEVVIKALEVQSTWGVYQITPSKTGADIASYIASNIHGGNGQGREPLAKAFMKGC